MLSLERESEPGGCRMPLPGGLPAIELAGEESNLRLVRAYLIQV